MSDLPTIPTIVFSVVGSELDETDGFPLEDDAGIFYGTFSCESAARAAIGCEIGKKKKLHIRKPYRYAVYMSELDEPVSLSFYDIWNFHYTSLEEGRPFWIDYACDPKILVETPPKAATSPKLL
jgi:hypothetical protein